jgi:murein DD-endopeptidase MepM/ murein hydrolase activator NlpD
MDRVATASAFIVKVDGETVAGTPAWAEDDTVLVMSLPRSLPYGARVELSVGPGARSFAGIALRATALASFAMVAPPPSPTPRALPRRPAAQPAQVRAPVVSRPPPATTTTGWAWPLLGPITQRFGETLTQYGVHQGIDIDGDTGDPVRAARGGTVVVAGTADSCGGLQVRIDHGGGVLSWYRHLSAVLATRGQAVAVGDVVGRVGNTGCSLGSHLHFGISRDGTFVDPLRYLPAR